VYDFKNKISWRNLTAKCGWATPNHSTEIEILNSKYPIYLFDKLHDSIYTTRRKPLIGKFFDKVIIPMEKLKNNHLSQGTVMWLWFEAGILFRQPRFDSHLGKQQKKELKSDILRTCRSKLVEWTNS